MKLTVLKDKSFTHIRKHGLLYLLILVAGIFDTLRQHRTGSGGEFQLTEAMDTLLLQQDFYGLRFSGGRYDCGEKVGLLEANIACFLGRPDLRMRAQKAVERFVLSSLENGEDK